MKVVSSCAFVALLWLGLCCSAHAAELFGIDLAQASRDQLRTAVRQSGVSLIREAGEDEFFDVYDSQALLPGSSRLYLGFVKSDQRFAFAEYEFSGLRQPLMLQKLRLKYGEPQRINGKYLSDQRYNWSNGEIQISLSVDWENHKTRLLYYQLSALTELRKEQKALQQKLLNEQGKGSEQAF